MNLNSNTSDTTTKEGIRVTDTTPNNWSLTPPNFTQNGTNILNPSERRVVLDYQALLSIQYPPNGWQKTCDDWLKTVHHDQVQQISRSPPPPTQYSATKKRKTEEEEGRKYDDAACSYVSSPTAKVAKTSR